MANLLSLPDELLDHVMSCVVAIDKRRLLKLCRVCRRLSHLAQARLYSDVELRGALDICALANTAQDRPGLVRKIETLRINYSGQFGKRHMIIEDSESEASSSDGNDSDIRRDSTKIVFKCGLREVLLASPLPKLSTLSLRAFPHLILQPTLTQAGSRSLWPSLKSLDIVLSATKGPDTCLSLWSALGAFPSLSRLSLSVWSLRFPINGPVPALHQVQELVLSGLTRYAAQLRPLRDLLPNLRTLSFDTSSTRSAVECLLLTGPDTLRSLKTPYLPSEAGRLTRLFGRFPALEQVHLGCSIMERTDLPALQTSRIRSLVLHGNARASDDFLLDLVGGPNKMRELRYLEVNLPRIGKTGDALYGALRASVDDADDDILVALFEETRAAYEPGWPDGCTPAGLLQVCEAAKRAGITVTGSALDCLGWDDEFDAQLERYIVDKAVETDDTTFLVDYYGRDYAMDVFRRRRPGLSALMMAMSLGEGCGT